MKIAYKTENDFSKALVKSLREAGFFVQRIESRETGCGIPDMFCLTDRHTPLFLELKRVHTSVLGKPAGNLVTVPWRPGQQAWLYLVSPGVPCSTLICFDDCFGFVPAYWIGSDRVPLREIHTVEALKDIAPYARSIQKQEWK